MCDSLTLLACKQLKGTAFYSKRHRQRKRSEPIIVTLRAQGRRDVEIIAANLQGGSGKMLL